MYLGFWFCLFAWYSYRTYDSWNSVENLCNNRRNYLVLLVRSKLNNIEVLVSKVLIDSNIIHDEFVVINNVLKEYNEMKEEIKNIKT